MRVALFVLSTLASLAIAQLSAAQPTQRFALNWVRDAGAEPCITSHRLAAILQGMFGPVFVTQDQADLAIEGSVSRPAEAWRARIVVSDRSGAVLGVRELGSAAESCGSLDAQIVLVIAMAIDPEVALQGLPPELLAELGAPADAADDLLSELRASSARAPAATATTSTTPSAQPAPAAPPAPRPEPSAPRASDDFTQVAASAQLGVSAELLPSSQPLIGIGLELRFSRRWALLAQGAWSLPSIVVIQSPSIRDASVRFDLSLASLAACFTALRTVPLRLAACAGPTLLVRGAEGRGLTSATGRTELDFAATVSAGAVYAGLSPWLFGIGAALHAPFGRPRFTYQIPGVTQTKDLFAPSVVALTSWLSVGAEL